MAVLKRAGSGNKHAIVLVGTLCLGVKELVMESCHGKFSTEVSSANAATLLLVGTESDKRLVYTIQHPPPDFLLVWFLRYNNHKPAIHCTCKTMTKQPTRELPRNHCLLRN